MVRITRIHRDPERAVDVARGGVSGLVGIAEPGPGRTSVGALPDPALIDRRVDGVRVFGIEIDAVDPEGVGEIRAGGVMSFQTPGVSTGGVPTGPPAPTAPASPHPTMTAPASLRTVLPAGLRCSRRRRLARRAAATRRATGPPGDRRRRPAEAEPPVELLPPLPAFVAAPPVPGLMLPASLPFSSGGGDSPLSLQPGKRASRSAARPKDIVVVVFTSSRMPGPTR